jgi:transposase-like protein
MSKHLKKEQKRRYVEQLLATDLSVAEWCKRNRINRQSMYGWLSHFAEYEPELFGGAQNITDRSKRRWLETTRKNMSASMALSTRHSPGVIIVDTLLEGHLPGNPVKESGRSGLFINVDINGAAVAIPAGSAEADITRVLKAVALL